MARRSFDRCSRESSKNRRIENSKNLRVQEMCAVCVRRPGNTTQAKWHARSPTTRPTRSQRAENPFGLSRGLRAASCLSSIKPVVVMRPIGLSHPWSVCSPMGPTALLRYNTAHSALHTRAARKLLIRLDAVCTSGAPSIIVQSAVLQRI